MPVVINGSTGISGVDGSAGTPAFQGSDTNTGIRFGTDIVSLVTGGSDRLYIDSSGRLGVGTTSPAQRLQVGDFSGSNVITIGAGTTSSSAIYFSDGNSGTEAYRGYIEYYHNSDALLIGASALERARIDSSGRLLVGTSSYSFAATAVLQGNSLASNEDATLRMNRGATPGASADLGLITFGDNAGNIGASIRATNDTASSWGSGDYPGRLTFSTTADGASSPSEAMRINNQRELLIGTTTRTANGGVLQVSNGITFPATQSACSDVNTLDDYEEGTFTPTVVGGTTAGTATYSTQSGIYRKIGNLVHISLVLSWTGGTGTGSLRTGGLPFNVNTTYLPVFSVSADSVTLTAGTVISAFSNLTTSIQIMQMPTGGGAYQTVTYDAAGTLYITGTYVEA